jgi:lipopolysaccharide biosynthesis glycosyltransferase
MKTNELEVWFAIDSRTSECGYVAAYSLLKQRAENSETKICVAFENGKAPPADWWSSLLVKTRKKFTLSQIPIDLNQFQFCKGVFDSRAAFLRILIPEYTSSETCIYTDADVIFQEDVENLTKDCELTGKTIGLVLAGPCIKQPEKEQLLLSRFGKKGEDNYYFSGLAVINNNEYKKQGVIDKSFKLCKSYASELSFHDQTVWNCILQNQAVIDQRWCWKAYPAKPISTPFEGGIVHFVGSPKPWDLLGEFFHPYSKIWFETATEAGLSFPIARRYIQGSSWKRALRIKQQYRSWIG